MSTTEYGLSPNFSREETSRFWEKVKPCHTTRPSARGKGSGGTSNGVELCGGWWPRKDVLGRNRA